MAYFSLQAKFFADEAGIVVRRAPPVSRPVARAIYERDGGKCLHCGAAVRFGGNSVSPFDRIRSGAVDHVIPRARGGQNDESNLRLLCMTCNARKGAK